MGTKVFMAILTMSTLSVTAQQNSRENIDFLSKDSYESLSEAYTDAAPNLSLMLSFGDAYLARAKRAKDSLEMAEGYYKIAKVHSAKITYDLAKTYLDSVILFSQKKPSKTYPAQAYITRANINGAQTNFSKAMDDLGKANTYASANGNIEQQYEVKYYISILKTGIGKRDEAISMLKEVIDFYDQGNTEGEKVEKYRYYSLFALGAEYNAAREPDSALIHLKKVIQLCLQKKDSPRYERFLRAAGFSYYLLGDYPRALDSTLKSQKVARTKENLAVSTPMSIHTTLGLIYDKLKDKEQALFHLKKMDSIAFAENYFYVGIQEPYKLLVQYSKEEGNTEKQLYYIDKLLHADSVANYNKQYVSQKVNEAYDIPNLLREKEEIITSLANKNQRRNLLLIGFLGLTISLLVLLIWYYRKQKLYKKRFQELMGSSGNTGTGALKPSEEAIHNIKVPEEIITQVLEKLEDFEKNNEYLQLNLSLGELAKRCHTNSKYFSKIINAYKGKSFSQYINDLRVSYATEKLKDNPKIRKFTIKAIAEEMGFNTSEAFSKSFYKTTGIYPSFYIKELEKQ